MNEQEIAEAVARIVRGTLTEKSSENGHVCKCKNRKITLAKAKQLAEAVQARAKEMGVKAVVAVADRGGNPILVQAMDDAYLASWDVALQKSYTVVALKMSTQKLASLAAPGGSLYGIQFTNQGKIVIFGGAEPLESDGKIVGGLGVSGGSAEQDTALAAFGKEIFKEISQC